MNRSLIVMSVLVSDLELMVVHGSGVQMSCLLVRCRLVTCVPSSWCMFSICFQKILFNTKKVSVSGPFLDMRDMDLAYNSMNFC